MAGEDVEVQDVVAAAAAAAAVKHMEMGEMAWVGRQHPPPLATRMFVDRLRTLREYDDDD